MKKAFGCLLTVLAAVLSGIAYAEDVQSLKLLTIGNSFSESLVRQLPKIVESAGKTIEHTDMYHGACSLKQHWENRENAAWYSNKMSIVEALKLKAWDVVTLQQASDYAADVSSYEPYFGNLVALIKELAPTAEIVIQQTWSWPKSGLTVDGYYDGLCAAYSTMAENYSFRQIPTGYAVQLYRHIYDGNPLSTDNRHLSKPAGEYLQSLVWAGKLFGIDPKSVAYAPIDMDAKTVAQMKDSAALALIATDLTNYSFPKNVDRPAFGTRATLPSGRTYPVLANGKIEQVIEFTNRSQEFRLLFDDEISTITYLAVGGGGAGGTCLGGGGAGGQVLTGTWPASVGGISVKIGAGGLETTARGKFEGHRGANGTETIVKPEVGDVLTAAGGGGAGGWNNAAGQLGGGSANGNTTRSVGPNGTKGGSGKGSSGTDTVRAGGGGAGAAGDGETSPKSFNAGNGGAGAASAITGTMRYYGAGGGGGAGTNAASKGGLGGSGVGGNGGWITNESDASTIHYATSGAANTGSGGGGGARDKWSAAGCGADGVVIVRLAAVNPIAGCLVTFKDADGTILSTDVVAVGSAAQAPTAPRQDGKIFAGWDRAFTEVAEDLVVTATYADAPTISEKNTTATGCAYVVTEGGIVYHVEEFHRDGVFTLPAGAAKFGLLAVGGGGAGSVGGGAGGAVYHREDLSPEAGDYELTIGKGGAAITADSPNKSNAGFSAGASGGATTVVRNGTILVTAAGGGGGAGLDATAVAAANGGGGSTGRIDERLIGAEGIPSDGLHQGFKGGNATNYGTGATGCGGGGGGAGAAGNGWDSQVFNVWRNNDWMDESAGRGGDGWAASITGEQVYYGAGGGGGVRRSNFKRGGEGGLGGGGNGAGGSEAGSATFIASTSGADGLGGGGGGGGWNANSITAYPSSGGSGIVVVRYALYSENPQLQPVEPSYPTEIIKAGNAEVKALYDQWVSDFKIVNRADDANLEAFLLNCAPEQVVDEKAAFKLSIKVVNGKVVVSTVEGKTYHGLTILGATEVDGEYTPGIDGKRFFKAVLSL